MATLDFRAGHKPSTAAAALRRGEPLPRDAASPSSRRTARSSTTCRRPKEISAISARSRRSSSTTSPTRRRSTPLNPEKGEDRRRPGAERDQRPASQTAHTPAAGPVRRLHRHAVRQRVRRPERYAGHLPEGLPPRLDRPRVHGRDGLPRPRRQLRTRREERRQLQRAGVRPRPHARRDRRAAPRSYSDAMDTFVLAGAIKLYRQSMTRTSIPAPHDAGPRVRHARTTTGAREEIVETLA